ncbi:a-factor receptor [Serendipita sp. 398]|nr:a-factor receptor [Serendipita sp. 398]
MDVGPPSTTLLLPMFSSCAGHGSSLPFPSSTQVCFSLKQPLPSLDIYSLFLVLTVRAFLRRRSTFNELLKSQGTGLNVHRYIRLMALASTEVLFVFPMTLAVFIRNVTASKPLPYRSWNYVHSNFGRIQYISRFFLTRSKETVILFEISRWCMPFSAILFFIFFGLASEARKQYKRTWNALMRRLGVTSPSLTFVDTKDTPSTAATARTKRPSYVKSGSTSTTMPMTSPTTDKKRPDTFAWLEEGLPFDELDYKLPMSPGTAYSPTKNHGGRPSHTPCTPSTSTSTSSTSHLWDTTSTIGRHASISTARTGKTTRFSQDDYADDATICGVPTSLKRSDSMGDKPLPEIPFEDFAYFRQSQIDNRNRDRERQSAALSIHSASSSSAASIGGGRKSRSLSLSQLMLPTLTQEQEQGYAEADNSFVLGDMDHHHHLHGLDGDADGDQVQITARHSAAPSSELDLELETQVQIFVSSPTSTTFTSRDPDHEHEHEEMPNMPNVPNVPNDIERSMTPKVAVEGEEGGRGTPTPSVRFIEPIPRTRLPAGPSDALSSSVRSRLGLAPSRVATPPTDESRSRPLSVVSQDGGETVFFTPLAGRLSLAPADFEMTPSGLRLVYVDEEGQRVSMYDDHDAADLQTPMAQ